MSAEESLRDLSGMLLSRVGTSQAEQLETLSLLREQSFRDSMEISLLQAGQSQVESSETFTFDPGDSSQEHTEAGQLGILTSLREV